jgi:hypothetical protein
MRGILQQRLMHVRSRLFGQLKGIVVVDGMAITP